MTRQFVMLGVATLAIALMGSASGSLEVRSGSLREPGKKAGERRMVRLRDSNLTLEMVWVPAGSFKMGEEAKGLTTISHGFWITRTEVTHAVYERFTVPLVANLKKLIKGSPAQFSKKLSEELDEAEQPLKLEPRFRSPDKPVVAITPKQMDRIATALTGETQAVWRMPTEMEWEYAARGPMSRPYPWGDAKPDKSLAVFGLDAEREGAAPVGSRSGDMSWCGAMDMAGNVREACSDVVPVDLKIDHRIIKGRSWVASNLTSLGSRLLEPYTAATVDIGLRLVSFPHEEIPKSNRNELNRALYLDYEGEYKAAIAAYESALELSGNGFGSVAPSAKVALARLLATCPDARYHDGKRAVELALDACMRSRWKESGIIEVLAAAYARAGEFDEAVKYQKQAMEHPDRDELQRAADRERLALYEARRAYTAPSKQKVGKS